MEPAFHSFRVSDDGAVAEDGDCGLILPWWSFSKTVIAIVAMRLAEEGRLTLDDRLPAVPYTLRDLLLHRSGLPDYGGSADYHAAVARGGRAWTQDQLLSVVPPVQMFPAGAGWAYSNIGYMLARDRVAQVTGRDMADLVAQYVTGPLGLASVRFAGTPGDFGGTGVPFARQYDPGWVYHGCLIGTARDAALLLHAVFAGHLLSESSLAQMRVARPLGGALPGRPWQSTGYATGLMSGRVQGAGRATGHSGGGPFSVCAVYHFPDLPTAPTVASFTNGTQEGVAEFRAVKIAVAAGGLP